MSAAPRRARAPWAVWVAAAVAVAALPFVFSSGASLTMMSLMGFAIIFALSYNMLLGQTGMLSFGHAVYYGLGGFMTAHALNVVGAGKLPVPLPVMPLVGGIAGLFFAIIFGWVSTKRAGTAFAMISLGIGELVAACSLILRGFFGGEGGISTSRTSTLRLFDISFGPQIQVYYLIAAWCLLCIGAMYAFTRTPLGRILNAVRDNPERVEFIGYSTQRVRYISFIISGFFAGIAGGMYALNFEIATAEVVGAARSGAYLFFTFLGGATFFFGPIIGAVLMVLVSVLLSEVTKAWLLYLGLIFMLMVMFAPGGIASLIMMNRRVAAFGKLRGLLGWYALLALTGALMFVGVAAMIEMIYHLQLDDGFGPTVGFMGLALNVKTAASWIGALAVVVVGAALFEFTRRRFARRWGEVQGEIEAAIQARLAA
jgi:branched-chain amino acid transport system permease protein